MRKVVSNMNSVKKILGNGSIPRIDTLGLYYNPWVEFQTQHPVCESRQNQLSNRYECQFSILLEFFL